jgi:nitrogen fixation protein FixH
VTAKTRWTLAIVGLLAGNVLAGFVLFAIAHHGASQVIPHYYDKAVHYDDALDQAAENRALGWSVAASIDHGVVTARVHDRAGEPLAGARVRVEGYPRAHAERHFAGDLMAAGAGVYLGPRAHDQGWTDLTVTVERGADRYVRRFAVEAR